MLAFFFKNNERRLDIFRLLLDLVGSRAVGARGGVGAPLLGVAQAYTPIAQAFLFWAGGEGRGVFLCFFFAVFFYVGSVYK